MSGNKQNIPGATGNSYSPVVADIGKYVGVLVTARNSSGSSTKSVYNYNTVIDASLAPNAAVSGTAQAGSNPGEIDYTFTPGTQIDGYPDTGYEIELDYGNGYSEWIQVISPSGKLEGISPGTYNIQAVVASNDITSRFFRVPLATGVVVS